MSSRSGSKQRNAPLAHNTAHAIVLIGFMGSGKTCVGLALSRALRNLMINAATHGRKATVRVAGADGADGAVAQVIIEDEGPGIPPELLCRVFEPFFRVDPGRRQNIAGAGLGLTIAREIVQRAGGDIRISNRNGGGLKQVVELAKVEEIVAVGSDALA